MKIRNIAIALACLAITACAPVTKLSKIDESASDSEKEIQREMALQQSLKRTVRANTVGHPILKHNASQCGDSVAASIGAIISNTSKFDKGMQSTASRLWGVTDKPTIIAVLKGSPAEQAGMMAGDQLSIIDSKILTGPLVNDPMSAWAKPYKTATPTTIYVVRNGNEIALTVTPDAVCDFPIQVVSQDAVNAFADGKQIYITTGMMRFAETDEELATVIGHELAHNQMGHLNKKQKNQLLGILLGAVITVATGVDVTNAVGNLGASAYSQEFEAEADYVGMYSCARAGYEIKASPNFWRRMGAEHPAAIAHGASHPNTANRFLALETTVTEIDTKRNAGQELLAEMKK
jgi:membrane-associated protease RseP (regulator of RpoE activity)